MKGAIARWFERHRNPVSLGLHGLGIPMTVAGIVLACLQQWVWAVGLFVGGYALQFIGHGIEGNDAGELILVKKALGKPYVAVVPRPGTEASDADPDRQDG